MKLQISQAIVVEGRDDVDAVGKAVDALLIPTHGFGIRAETWELIEKAYSEKGLIILTDPDFSGEEIRKKLTARFPDAIQAYISADNATIAGDIGVENATPQVIAAAITQALANTVKKPGLNERPNGIQTVKMDDMVRLRLAGVEGASELRQAVCAKLGIGYGNARAMIKKLQHWGIGVKELEQAVEEVK